MGKHNASHRSAYTARLLIPCHGQRLIDTINAVVADPPSLK